jgi:hypothetical protein
VQFKKTIFANQFFDYRLEHTNGNGPFFLSIDYWDPSDTFIARFAMLNKTVRFLNALIVPRVDTTCEPCSI